MRSLQCDLEESVTTLSGTWTPGPVAPNAAVSNTGQARQDFIDPRLLTPIGPQFTGNQLIQTGILPPHQSAPSYGPPPASFFSAPKPAVPAYSAPAPASGPDWTPQPGMLYAAGQAYTPQQYINKFGYATYLSVAGNMAPAAATVAPAPDFSSGSAPVAPTPSNFSQQVVLPGGLSLPKEQTGQIVSTNAATMNFSQYFGGSGGAAPGAAVKPTEPIVRPSQPAIHHPPTRPPVRPQRPLRGFGADDEVAAHTLYDLLLLAVIFVGLKYVSK